MKILILYIISNHSLLYIIQTEGPGVARGKKKCDFFLAFNTPGPHEGPQKISAHSVQPFVRL